MMATAYADRYTADKPPDYSGETDKPDARSILSLLYRPRMIGLEYLVADTPVPYNSPLIASKSFQLQTPRLDFINAVDRYCKCGFLASTIWIIYLRPYR